jgi:hypothetical protein
MRKKSLLSSKFKFVEEELDQLGNGARFLVYVKILTVWKGKFWQFGKEILTVWKGKFWQFKKGIFDSLKREIWTVWKGKFWRFEKGNFDGLKREILTVWKGKFWRFEKGNFDGLSRPSGQTWETLFSTTKQQCKKIIKTKIFSYSILHLVNQIENKQKKKISSTLITFCSKT